MALSCSPVNIHGTSMPLRRGLRAVRRPIGGRGWPLRGWAGLAARVRAMDYRVRRARTGDVRAIRRLIDANVASGRLLDKPTVTLYEDIQEFLIAERADGMIAG